jgi:myo-inositol 2-dehydrogenase / D-chiro-inositol 1-dehydrogenase
MATPLRIGVIGAGRIGVLHARNLATRLPGVRLEAISDVVAASAEKCAAELGVPSALTDHRRILERKDIDAVVICSSTDTHARLIGEAAEAGKHVFCEKPIDHDLAKIDEALAKVARAGVKLQVGFNRRFDPSFSRVRELVAGGGVGTPHLLRITSRDPSPPPIAYVKVSGGIFLDMTIHDFDMARFQMGCEVTELYAAGGVLVDPEIGKAGDLDTAVITLRFQNGAIGTIDNSRKSVFGYDQRLEVFGSGGMAEAANAFPNTVTLSNGKSVARDLPLNFFLDRYAESYVREMEAFVACVRDGKEPPVSGRDGRVPVVMGRAARLSAEQNRPVKLSEME